MYRRKQKNATEQSYSLLHYFCRNVVLIVYSCRVTIFASDFGVLILLVVSFMLVFYELPPLLCKDAIRVVF